MDGQREIRQGIKQRGVAQHADEGPQQQEPDVVPRQQRHVKGVLRRRHDVVAVADHDDREAYHQKGNEPCNPQRPAQGYIFDHPVRGERKNDTADPGPSGGDPVGQAASFEEPLREDGHTRDVDAADADPDQCALGEVQLPRSNSERGRDEPASEAEHAEDHRRTSSIPTRQIGDEWGHQHGGSEVEAADEGEIEGAGAGEGVGSQVVGEVDPVGLGDVRSTWFGDQSR